MKLMSIALGLGLIGASSAFAAPIYVGEQVTPENNISLGFQDTPIKEQAGVRTDTGNIAAIEVKADYSPVEHVSLGASLPFYMASKNVSGTSRNSMGNFGLTGGWNMVLSQSSDDFQWGYSAALDAYLPTSRKAEGAFVANANPTTDLFAYSQKATTIHPRVGLFIDGDRFYGKTNVGYGFTYLSSPAGSNDKNRNTITWQTAATYKAMENLNANLEYNTMILDSETAGSGNGKYKHALTPSLSGDYNRILGQAFVNIPLDSETRDVQNVAIGASVGYQF
ncbi:MAG: hypothetical protein COV44_04820 [Deltaproteobacteria bacterium CG11_big_fil_rev_8_21_14_0_20_45_16]|nr:MAG: hypothetical protein COV44_04820 [Deltaproteobacteria bacterium CG11_big_fil_rev_8_21_14_0_20_45_16]